MKRAGASVLCACLTAGCLVTAGCSLGEGDGDISSDNLRVAGCWNGPFDLRPDFFAASPYRNSLTIRVQHGGDVIEVSDGVSILVDDIATVENNLGSPLAVGLPLGVTPPGVPIVYHPDPPIIHLTVYLHRACHAQNSALYAIGGTMTFNAIFSGDPNESTAARKLTDAVFSDVIVADPRDLTPDQLEGASGDAGSAVPSADGGATADAAGEGGALLPAPASGQISHLRGNFRFYFQRGQPAQPFP